jgi:hypothetical protein
VVGAPQARSMASALHADQFLVAHLVEGWFSLLTERRLRRGTFSSVDHLIEAIETWAEHWNDNPKPFVWHMTAQETIRRVRRGRTSFTRVKSATDH